ncbi:MAG: serine/threonine protein kinase [Actinomycetota bacterium]|nr:serine/threonine protein kinase [Actinomycetota bacterium]
MIGWSVPGVVHLREVCEDPGGRRVLARHRITRRPLAVTYLSDELLTDTEFRARFAREFERLARVRDARVSRVHRYVEYHRSAAVVGDHVSGTSLRALLLAHGAVGIEAALVVLKDSLRGLAAYHAAGLAHGDIKPEGVILTRAGCVRLVDFGLSTSHGRRLLARSTPFYLAPEQWNDRSATPTGDVYAATVMFFECLIGAPPFYADSSAELAVKHDQSSPPLDVIPQPARELVVRGLTKDPHSRPTARSLLAHVDDVAARAVGTGWERRGRRELVRLLSSRSAVPDKPTLARRRGDVSWERRSPVRLAAVVGGALALAAGLSSPPLAVILPGGSIFGSDARSPVLAFPEPAHGSSPVRAVTNGQLADRAPDAVPAAKAAPAGRELIAGPQPNKKLPPTPSIPTVNRQIALDEYPTHAGYPAGSVHQDEDARDEDVRDEDARIEDARTEDVRDEDAQPGSVPTPACTPMLISEHKPCAPVSSKQGMAGSTETASTKTPASINLPASIELPARIQASMPVFERVQQQKEIRSLWNARNQNQKDAHAETLTHRQVSERVEHVVDSYADWQPHEYDR